MNICKLHTNAVVPTYAHETDACFDLVAATVDGNSHIGKTVYEGAPLMCGTGLAFEVPAGYAMLVAVPRVTFEVVEQLGLSERGTGGFGSTGNG